VLATGSDGSVRTLVNLPERINPIAVVGRGDAPRGGAKPGFYVTDTITTNVYFLPAAVLTRYPNTVILGAQKTVHLWLVRATATATIRYLESVSLEVRARELGIIQVETRWHPTGLWERLAAWKASPR
jgi:hypothetical protein